MNKILKGTKIALSLNQKWYFTLCIAIVINVGWNYINTRATFRQGERITELERENLALKQTNVELLSRNFQGQRILDQLPFAIWKKKKSGNHFVMKFINEVGKDQFLASKGVNRYFYHNKTDFEIFEYEDARKFYVEDSLVAFANSDTVAHFNTDFFDAKGNKLIEDGYTRWREIEDGDTLIWGKMDKFYKKDYGKK